jgi:CubicO group peptidase (beta-lactamase class C family)
LFYIIVTPGFRYETNETYQNNFDAVCGRNLRFSFAEARTHWDVIVPLNSDSGGSLMSFSVTRRGFLKVGRQAIAGVVATRFFVLEFQSQEAKSQYVACFKDLDTFVEQYMREMNAPGMTLVMADRDGVQRVATYGFGDTESHVAIQPQDLFEIGSISKSFVANCLLQLHQEGKLDLQKPIAEYLPWFRIESKFSPINTHHLLTHTSGLPGDGPLFLSDPAAKHRAAYAPGNHFHYCNTGYVALGHLVWTLDGQSLAESFRTRIFNPLGMTRTEPFISLDIREKLAKNYMIFQNDRPYPRHGRLVEAPGIVMTDGAGCIASTPHDMGLYIQMIAKLGRGPKGSILSKESFDLFSQPHIKADEFGPTASYGYGIAVDALDGHKILRHTGGMVSFASALHVDIDEGVGAFASINAMQGYRPNPVAQYAMQLMRTHRAAKPLPAMPITNSPNSLKNASDYLGKYESSDGHGFEVVASGENLFLIYQGSRVALENANGDMFIVPHPDFQHFMLVFSRSDSKDPHSSVVEASSGGQWFTNSKYTGPKVFTYPKEWERYVGHYRNESPWVGSVRIVLRKDKLMVDGLVVLEPGEDGMFILQDEENSPEWIRFDNIVNGRAMHLKLSGEDLWRVMAS